MAIRWLLRLLTELSSSKILSIFAGKFAKSEYSRFLVSRFAKAYGIRIEEAEKKIEEYRTLNEFFIRRLKPGIRPVDPNPDSLICPVDSVITGMGHVRSGEMLNVKGQNYSIEALLHHSPRTINYKNGFYFVLYLSPSDYHRIHSPVSGTINEKEHVKGRVYPVNEFGLTELRNVLSRNERLITYIQHEYGEIALVKVGAMNVSSIQYVSPLPDKLEKGDELAYFEFGSTVVLLTENHTFTCREDLAVGQRVKVGEALGFIHPKPAKNTNGLS